VSILHSGTHLKLFTAIFLLMSPPYAHALDSLLLRSDLHIQHPGLLVYVEFNVVHECNLGVRPACGTCCMLHSLPRWCTEPRPPCAWTWRRGTRGCGNYKGC